MVGRTAFRSGTVRDTAAWYPPGSWVWLAPCRMVRHGSDGGPCTSRRPGAWTRAAVGGGDGERPRAGGAARRSAARRTRRPRRDLRAELGVRRGPCRRGRQLLSADPRRQERAGVAATSSSSVSSLGRLCDRLADVLARKARAGVAVRICVDANGSAPAARRGRCSGVWRPPAPTWWSTTACNRSGATGRSEPTVLSGSTLAASATSTIASWSSSTTVPAGSGRASRTTSGTASSTTSSCASAEPSCPSSSSSPWRASLPRRARLRVLALFPDHGSPRRTPSPAWSSTMRPARCGRSGRHRRAVDDARECSTSPTRRPDRAMVRGRRRGGGGAGL